MTGSTRSSDGLDARRRRLLFRSWHRGTREADLIMGRFADAHIEGLSDAELDEYEHLLDCPIEPICWPGSPALRDVPAEHDTAMFRRVRDFHPARALTRWRNLPPNCLRPTAADAGAASPTAPKGWSSPISPARSRRAPNAPATSAARDLPRRAAHGGAGARAVVLRARHRGAAIPGLGLPALRPRVAACRRRGAAHDRAVAARPHQGPRQAGGAAHHGQRRAAARAGARADRASRRCRPRPATCSAWTASSAGSSSTASTAPRRCASPAITRCAAASSTCFRRAWTCRCGSISSATRWKRSAASIRRRSAP